jgi:hypothetical protein
MGRLLDRPMLAYRVLAPLLVVTFLLSGTNGGNNSDNTPDDGFVYYLSAGGWVAFGVTLLATVAFTLVVLVHSIRTRRAAVD